MQFFRIYSQIIELIYQFHKINVSSFQINIKNLQILLFSILSMMMTVSIVYESNNSFALENQTNENEFNAVAAGDFGCSHKAQSVIKDIEETDPDLFLAAGDLSYEKSPACWINITKSLDPKIKVAIGNHDDDEEKEGSKELKKSLLNHYNLNKSYYSFDYKNLHVLVLDSQLELSVDTIKSTAIVNKTLAKKDEEKKTPSYPTIKLTELLDNNSVDFKIPVLDDLIKQNATVRYSAVDDAQYKFVINDLAQTSLNKDIDWIIVMMHKPMYAAKNKHLEEYIIREKYHEIFDKYGVDLVIQAHSHIYSRTEPLSYNNLDIYQPIVDSPTNNNNTFVNPKGITFLVVGTGGREMHDIREKPYYIVNDYDKGYGFLELKIAGKNLGGIFHKVDIDCGLVKKISKGDEKDKDLEICNSVINSTTESNNEPFFTATSSTFVDVTNDPSLQLTQFSTAAWFKTSANLPNPGFIVNKGGFGSEVLGQNLNYGLWLSQSERLEGGFETPSGSNLFVTSPSTVNDGQWHHGVVTYDGSVVRLYIDGVQVTTLSTTNTPDNTGNQPLRIGADSQSLSNFFVGDVDKVGVWDRPLTQTEIYDLINNDDFAPAGLEYENSFDPVNDYIDSVNDYIDSFKIIKK